MAALLLPMGRGNLKETMAAQRFSFVALVVLLGVFYAEFMQQGAGNELLKFTADTLLPTGEAAGPPPIPWWGRNLSTLGGVVLFNYAYAITLPSWLIEKKTSVGVNATVWPAVFFSTFLYLTFGVMAATAFRYVPADILTILASKQVHYVTQVSAAVFGVTIIGLGEERTDLRTEIFYITNAATVCPSHSPSFRRARVLRHYQELANRRQDVFPRMGPLLVSLLCVHPEMSMFSYDTVHSVIFQGFCVPILVGVDALPGNVPYWTAQLDRAACEWHVSIRASACADAGSHLPETRVL